LTNFVEDSPFAEAFQRPHGLSFDGGKAQALSSASSAVGSSGSATCSKSAGRGGEGGGEVRGEGRGMLGGPLTRVGSEDGLLRGRRGPSLAELRASAASTAVDVALRNPRGGDPVGPAFRLPDGEAAQVPTAHLPYRVRYGGGGGYPAQERISQECIPFRS